MGTIHDLDPRRYLVTTVVTIQQQHLVSANSEEEATEMVQTIIEASSETKINLGPAGLLVSEDIEKNIVDIMHQPSMETSYMDLSDIPSNSDT